MLPTKFRFIWPSGFRGEDFLEINVLEFLKTLHACLLPYEDPHIIMAV
jgi:hypothetical protein